MSTDRAADVTRLRAQIGADPRDAVAWHNLASAQGDLGHAVEAEAAARRAIALGLAAPETRFVLARAIQDQGRLDEAERCFAECLRSRPGYPEAHRDLAQLRWMRSGELTQALAALDTAIADAPRDPALRLVRSVVLEFAGDLSGALATARHGLGLAPTEVSLLQQAAHLSAELGEASAALTWARKAAALGPDDPAVAITLCEALLGSGEILEAESVASRLHAASPLDQHAIALQATAWRLKGDPRYGQLHDYSSVVASERLAPPRGGPASKPSSAT